MLLYPMSPVNKLTTLDDVLSGLVNADDLLALDHVNKSRGLSGKDSSMYIR